MSLDAGGLPRLAASGHSMYSFRTQGPGFNRYAGTRRYRLLLAD
jgi:hypothetical protein